ncbi:peptidylprolyl isomerase [Candidatus Parcubacteria bacterium]|nr:peptidylprolyl isomerase [Candidatus Parcubacteria bacterium]
MAAALVLAVLGLFGVLIYKYKSDSPVVYAAAQAVPYPVMRVNGSFVDYAQYRFELDSIKQYYRNQVGPDNQPAVDFNSAEGKTKLAELRKQILEQLKVDTVTRQLIRKHKISVSDKEVNEQVDQIVKSSGGMDKVKEVLTKFYGWEVSDLKDKVKFQLAKQKLQEKIAEDENINAQAKTKAEAVLAEVKGGGDFAELARKHSQDSSASAGGDLGFFGKGQMVPEFETAAFALQPGQTSDLIKTKFGYHIIKVTEKKDDTVKASHILIKTTDFEQYLKEQTEKAKISVYLKV